MAVRPVLDDETVQRLNEAVAPYMSVDPTKVGVGDRVNVLLDRLEESEAELRRARNQLERLDRDNGGF